MYQRLREFIDLHSIKQITISAKIGMDNDKLNRLLNGKQEFKGDDFTNIVNGLREYITPDDLYYLVYGLPFDTATHSRSCEEKLSHAINENGFLKKQLDTMTLSNHKLIELLAACSSKNDIKQPDTPNT